MFIRRHFAVVAIAFSVSLAAAPLARATEEDSVRAAMEREIAAWEKYDPQAVAACFVPDAVWQNPFGARFHSSAELEKFLNRLFARPGYRSARDVGAATILDVRLTSPVTAVAWTEERSEGQIDDATGKPMAPRHSHTLDVLIKKAGVWKITDEIIMDEYPRPTPSAAKPSH